MIKRGFSLMEMMVVMLIVAVIAAATAPMINKKMIENASGDSPWIWTSATNNSIAFNIHGNDNSPATIGAVKPPSDVKTMFHIQTKTDEVPQITLGHKDSNSPLKIMYKGIGGDDHFLGISSKQPSPMSIAIGPDAESAKASIAIGDTAKTIGRESVAIGCEGDYSSQTTANEYSVAIGSGATSGPNSVAISAANPSSADYISTTATKNSIAIGNAAADENSVAVGYSTKSAKSSVVIGPNTKSYAENSIILNTNTKSLNLTETSKNSIIIGDNITYSNKAYTNVVIGTKLTLQNKNGNTNSDANNNVVIGFNAISNGYGNVIIGHNANIKPAFTSANQYSEGSIAIGREAEVTHEMATAVGEKAKAKNDFSTAIGAQTGTTGKYSTAVGFQSSASGEYSAAFGFHAQALHKNSIAIGSGYNVKTTRENEIVLGDKDTTVYIPGNIVVGHVSVLGVAPSGSASTFIEIPDGNGWNPVNFKADDGGGKNVKTLRKFCDFSTDDIHDVNWGKHYDALSDRRLKDVGEVFQAGLEEVKKLEVFNYTFKKDPNKTPRVGVMAQDLEKIFPKAVTKGDDGFLRIRMEDMFYAVVNAVKELDNRLSLLEQKQKRIDELEERLDKLEKKLEKLEKKMK